MSTESTNEEKDYEVGYRRPPKSGQFKKGQSGNPGGASRAVRARKAKSTSTFGDLLSKGMQEIVEVEENGKKVFLTRIHLAIRVRVNAAAKGNLPALKELLKMREAKELGPLEPVEILVLTPDEVRACASREVIDKYLCEHDGVWKVRPREVVGSARRPARRVEASPPRPSVRELIDSELARQVSVTKTATGTSERMTMREAIAEQLMRQLSAGKPGVYDLIMQLDKLAGAPRKLVYMPWEIDQFEEAIA